MAGSLPVFISMAFKPSPRGYRTMMGVTPARPPPRCSTPAPTCSAPTARSPRRRCPPWCAEFRAATDAPLVMQPNAGQPRLLQGHTVYEETPEHFASFMPAIVAAGANLVGGCCGTTPA